MIRYSLIKKISIISLLLAALILFFQIGFSSYYHYDENGAIITEVVFQPENFLSSNSLCFVPLLIAIILILLNHQILADIFIGLGAFVPNSIALMIFAILFLFKLTFDLNENRRKHYERELLFQDVLIESMNDKNASLKQLAKTTKISKFAIFGYASGLSFPNKENIVRLEEVLQISFMDYHKSALIDKKKTSLFLSYQNIFFALSLVFGFVYFFIIYFWNSQIYRFYPIGNLIATISIFALTILSFIVWNVWIDKAKTKFVMSFFIDIIMLANFVSIVLMMIPR